MKNIFYILTAVAIIIGAGYFGVWVTNYIPTGWIPFIAAGLGFAASRIYESWKESKARLHEKKREVYSKLLKPYQSILIGSLSNKVSSSKKTNDVSPAMIELAANAAFDTILYGSDDVVRAYGTFRNVNAGEQVSTEMTLRNLSRLLKAMRKDLGHSWTTLNDAEILEMFINLTTEEKIKFKSINSKK
jgi:hypothetical protein